MSKSKSLVDHLLGLDVRPSYKQATEHPFLVSVGQKSVSKALLTQYLAQDYVVVSYAYPRFLAQLATKIPSTTFPRHISIKEGSVRSPSTNSDIGKKALELIAYATTNIIREAKFFEEVAVRNLNTDIEEIRGAAHGETAQTRMYVGEMARVSSWGTFEEGVVFLWAAEKLYFDAWSYAKGQSSDDVAPVQVDQDVLKAAPLLVDNWTNVEFGKFVDELARLVDALGIESDSDAWKRAEEVYKRVVDMEVAFWPTEDRLDVN